MTAVELQSDSTNTFKIQSIFDGGSTSLPRSWVVDNKTYHLARTYDVANQKIVECCFWANLKIMMIDSADSAALEEERKTTLLSFWFRSSLLFSSVGDGDKCEHGTVLQNQMAEHLSSGKKYGWPTIRPNNCLSNAVKIVVLAIGHQPSWTLQALEFYGGYWCMYSGALWTLYEVLWSREHSRSLWNSMEHSETRAF